MHLLRVLLPDRPGSLGVIASAMGAVGADIHAMEIVEKHPDGVVDDFMLELPPGALAETVVGACNELDGVRVLWISRQAEGWGLEGDVEVLNRMLVEPEQALEVLTEAAPAVFHCQWAALLDARSGNMLLGTPQAPDLTSENSAVLGALEVPHVLELSAGWLPMWGDAEAAVCPAPRGRSLVLGRVGGPPFLASELRRLQHLAALS